MVCNGIQRCCISMRRATCILWIVVLASWAYFSLTGCVGSGKASGPDVNGGIAETSMPSPQDVASSDFEDLGPLDLGLNSQEEATRSSRSGTSDSNIIIDWTEASNYIGSYVTIEGPVVSVVEAYGSKGSPIFINIGADGYSYNRVTGVIWESDRGNVDWNLWNSSGGSYGVVGNILRITGMPYRYEDGSVQIRIVDGEQVAMKAADRWIAFDVLPPLDYSASDNWGYG